MAIVLLVSCHDDNQSYTADTDTWKALLTTGEKLDAEKHYQTIGVKLEGLPAGTSVKVSTDADWLAIETDTLPSDGLFDVLPEANTVPSERTAKLTLTNLADGSSQEVEVSQSGITGENSGNSKYKIGYGFSCFDEYKSAKSIRRNVIDEAKLRSLGSDSTFTPIQESTQEQLNFEYFSAYSLAEMQQKLTTNITTSLSILGFKKTVNRYHSISKKSSNEQYYGYGKYTRIVGSQSIDEGVLKYVCKNENYIKNDKLPFSDAFYETYKSINNASGNERAERIKNMIRAYGTHVIMRTSLGGTLDLAVTYSRTLKTSMEETVKSVFHSVVGKKTSTEVMSTVSSSLSGDGAITIQGGSQSTREALQKNVAQLSTDANSSLSSTLMSQWMSSITFDDKNTLEAVDFTFIPIWELFPKQDVRNAILQAVTDMTSEQKNVFSDDMLGIDNYELALTDDMMTFGTSGDATLVRLVYHDKTPIAEVCNEYVPKVRSDKRITVIYPIANGMTRISMGIFPGDGENRPALLTFSKGSVYVNPLDNYGYSDKLDKIYYLHGALYATDNGIPLKQLNKSVSDYKLQLAGSSHSYPVVKIGSGYWTRNYMEEEMKFGVSANGRFKTYETIEDQLLFANIYKSNLGSFLTGNKGIFGPDVNEATGLQSLWYLPLTTDRQNLTEYLGNNLKCMFKGQQTGFEAQFAGYYGSCDEYGNHEGKTEIKNKGMRCYVPFKGYATSSQGEALVLTSDYHWQTIQTSASFNYYPVKLFRTSQFKYDNK